MRRMRPVATCNWRRSRGLVVADWSWVQTFRTCLRCSLWVNHLQLTRNGIFGARHPPGKLRVTAVTGWRPPLRSRRLPSRDCRLALSLYYPLITVRYKNHIHRPSQRSVLFPRFYSASLPPAYVRRANATPPAYLALPPRCHTKCPSANTLRTARVARHSLGVSWPRKYAMDAPDMLPRPHKMSSGYLSSLQCHSGTIAILVKDTVAVAFRQDLHNSYTAITQRNGAASVSCDRSLQSLPSQEMPDVS